MSGLNRFSVSRDSLSGAYDVVTRFRPYQLNPGLPAGGVDRHAFYARKFPDPERLATAREAIKENARLAGFSFDPAAPALLPNTVKAHQIIRLSHFTGKEDAATLAIYRAFWDDLRDIGDDRTLIDIAKSVGIDDGLAAAALGSPEDAAMVEAECDSFQRAGVSGVPTFIVNERTGFSGGMAPDMLASALSKAAAITREMT